MLYQKELNAAIEAGLKAKEVVLSYYHNGFDVEIKSDNSPVTEADKESDKIIRNYLKVRFPNYAFLTEESIDNLDRLNNDYVWIIDPVDGTEDFVHKDDEFTINIALSYKHEAVLGVVLIPAKNLIYYATKGNGAYCFENGVSRPIHVSNAKKDLRCLCSKFHPSINEKETIKKHSDLITKVTPIGSSIKACFIADGKAEISYRLSDGTKEWDTCAFQVIVEEAGGLVLKPNKEPIRYNREDVYNREGYLIINRIENFLL